MIYSKKKFKIFLTLFVICLFGIILSGCSGRTMAEQQAQCEQSGKKFTIQSEFSFTTGKIHPVGNCN